MNINGYIGFYDPAHHLANKAGIVYEHMVIAEQKLGRSLKTEEVIHHKDGNRSNNSPDNLIIFATISDHSAFHGQKEPKLWFDEEGVAHCNKNEWICTICGKPISKGAKYCTECLHKLQRKCERPTRDELKQLIRTTPFITIGKQYGVTDNAIRKWCDSMNLPRKKIEIKKYSDEEWSHI